MAPRDRKSQDKSLVRSAEHGCKVYAQVVIAAKAITGTLAGALGLMDIVGTERLQI